MNCWRERRISFVLHSCEAPKIEVVRAFGCLCQGRTAGNDERGAWYCVQAFVGGGGYRVEGFIGKVDVFGSEAADTVHEQTQTAFTAQFAQGLQIIEPTGG